jgi:cell division septation protein DedD
MQADRDHGESSVVRNLEQIQEVDVSARPSRAGALVLASLSGACIVLAAALLVRSPRTAHTANVDPLAELLASSRAAAVASASEKVGQDVTFPSLLSDVKQPTTALEAVREGRPAPPVHASDALPVAPDLPRSPSTDPADRLPVVPLPAQSLLQDPSRDVPTGDTLGILARRAAQEGGTETAPTGGPGGYQLQVSSFKTQAEAEAFAAALRRRGHKAYVEAARVRSRGTWHRVRIGPFKYRHAAVIYRQEFEAKERMVTFIVDPPKEGGPWRAGSKGAARLQAEDDTDE